MKNCLTLFVAMLITTSIYAQTGAHVQSFQSPTAASLGEFVETPVSLYTGIPQITIPLFELDHYGLKIPVYLGYNASGQKPDQFASWVGLGWNLNAGGIITRQVKGLPDDHGYGFYHQGYKLQNVWNQIGATTGEYIILGDNTAPTPYLQEIVSGFVDSQPDVFYVNALGINFKFIISHTGEVITFPNSKIKIEFTEAYQGTNFDYFSEIIVTLENGIKYVFADREVTGQYYDPFNPNSQYTSSWYLSEVILPHTDETVQFNYIGGLVNPHSYAFSYEEDVYHDGIWKNNSGNKNIYITSIFLDEIIFSNGTIKTNTSARNLGLLVGERQLDEIIQKNNKGETIKKFNMSYSDLTNRLTLNSISEFGRNNVSLKGDYQFGYVSQKLPLSASKRRGQDHWGYFNGKSNSTLLPKLVINGPNLYYNNSANYGDRSIDPGYVKAGMLKKIRYPLGGEVEFEYEINDYSYSNEPIYGTVDKSLSLTSYNASTESETIVIDNQSTVMNISVDLTLNGICSCNSGNIFCPSYQSDFVEIYKSGQSNPVQSFYWTQNQICNNAIANYSFSLTPGTYELKVHSFYAGDQTIVNANWTNYEEVDIGTASGLRIQKMTIKDGVDQANSKVLKYKYREFDSPNLSSGHLFSTPKYTFYPNTPSLFFSHSSKSKIPLGSGGSIVGYKEVRVEHTNEFGADFGRVDYTFNHVGDVVLFQQNHSPLNTVISNSWKRGNQVLKTTLSSSNDKTEEIESNYQEFSSSNYQKMSYGLDVHSGKFIEPSSSMQDGLLFVYRRPYVYTSSLYKKIEEKVRTYGNSTNFIENVVEWFFQKPSHMQLTKTIERNSDDTIRTTEYDYAHEVYGSGMEDLNMITQPYSVAIKDGSGNFINKQWTLWDQFNGNWRPCGVWVWNDEGSSVPTPPANCSLN